MNNEHDLDRLHEALVEHFANKPPADVVPRPGLDRDALLALNRHAGQDNITTTQDGTLDGDTMTVGAPTRYTDPVTAPMVPRAALERAGLTDADVPNVIVVDK